MKRPDAKALQAQCDAFNAVHPVCAPVTVRRDCGELVDTVTRSTAEVLSGHTAVVWLQGISGCYLLDRVTPRAVALAAAATLAACAPASDPVRTACERHEPVWRTAGCAAPAGDAR